MDDTLTVGRVARAGGVTPKTVRYYEAIGLLPPAARGSNGYRHYRQEDLHRLLFIQRAKALGLSLAEIQELVAVAEHGRCALTQAELKEILARKIADCTRRVEALIAFRTTLEQAVRRLDAAEEPGEPGGCPHCAAFAPSCSCLPAVRPITLT